MPSSYSFHAKFSPAVLARRSRRERRTFRYLSKRFEIFGAFAQFRVISGMAGSVLVNVGLTFANDRLSSSQGSSAGLCGFGLESRLPLQL